MTSGRLMGRGALLRRVPVVVVRVVRAEMSLVRTRAGVPPVVRLSLDGLARRHRVTLDLHDSTPPAAGRARLPEWAAGRERVVHAVLGRWPWGDTCLLRALVLGRELAALGPVLRLGPLVGPDGALTAHAWLEVDGLPIHEPATTSLVVRR